MQWWEYMNAWVSSPCTRPNDHADEMLRYGAGGWEMISIIWYSNDGTYLAFFKRPKMGNHPYRG